MRGYFEVGVYHPKKEVNIGTIWRSAHLYGASGLFTIGRRYQRQASDTSAATRHIPLRGFASFDQFMEARPQGALLVAVEEGGTPLRSFTHPEQAIYLFGAEDYGIPKPILDKAQITVGIESVIPFSMNVASTASIVLWHRHAQQEGGRKW